MWFLHLEGFFKHRLLGSSPRISDWLSLGWGLIICISIKTLLKLLVQDLPLRTTDLSMQGFLILDVIYSWPQSWLTVIVILILYKWTLRLRGLNSFLKLTQVMWEERTKVNFVLAPVFFCIPSLISGIILIMLYFWRRGFGLHSISSLLTAGVIFMSDLGIFLLSSFMN